MPNYPTSLDTYTPVAGTSLVASADHAAMHNNVGSISISLENKIGIGSGTPTTGGLLYSPGNGTSSWLGVGLNGQFLTTNGTTPSWGAVSAASDGWIADTNAWAVSGSDGPTGTVLVTGDLTTTLQPGDRVKISQGSTRYFIVSKTPTLTTGTTTLTMYGGTQYTLGTAAITSPYYSHQKAPYGFNTSPANWTEEFGQASLQNQGTPSVGTWYNIGTAKLDLPIGVWDLNYMCNVQCNAIAGQNFVLAALSTANNTASDADLVSCADMNSVSAWFSAWLNRRKTIAVTTKTTYYLNAQTGAATSPTQLYFRGDNAKTMIRAIFALL